MIYIASSVSVFLQWSCLTRDSDQYPGTDGTRVLTVLNGTRATIFPVCTYHHLPRKGVIRGGRCRVTAIHIDFWKDT